MRGRELMRSEAPVQGRTAARRDQERWTPSVRSRRSTERRSSPDWPRPSPNATSGRSSARCARAFIATAGANATATGNITTPDGFSSVAIAASRFNRLVTDPLVAGAVEELRRHGVAEDDVDLAWVPGAFELPLAAERLAASGRYAAVVAVGAVVRGATPHFDHVAGQAAAGLAAVGRATGVPVAFGVLTCDTMEQALDRAGGKAGNKGAEAAVCALEMAGLLEAIDKEAG